MSLTAIFLVAVGLPVAAVKVVALDVCSTTVVPSSSMTANGIVVLPDVRGVVE